MLNTFRNLYGFLSQVIPFQDNDLEKLYTYARFLSSKLPHRATGEKYAFDDEVSLKFYRLQKISEGSINLDKGDNVLVAGPTAVGTSKSKDDDIELSRLIDAINERFGTDFTQADELFFLQLREEAIADEELRQAASANTLDNFRYVFVKALEGLFIDRMEQNEEIFAKYMNDDTFRKVVSEHLLKQVYEQIRQDDTATAAQGLASSGGEIVARQFGSQGKWLVINDAIFNVIGTREDGAFYIGDMDSVAKVASCDATDVLAVLSLLSRRSAPVLRLVLEPKGNSEAEVPSSELTKKLADWWKAKKLPDEEWRAWAGSTLVKWVPAEPLRQEAAHA